MKIAGANLVITGGASGLGLHMATQFAALGGRIAILDRDQAALDNLPETLSDAVLCRCDLTDPAQVERSFRDLSDRMGKQQVLGPEVPYIFKIRNLFLQEIHIKLPRENTNLKAAKHQIAQAIFNLRLLPDFKGIRVVADVDPV